MDVEEAVRSAPVYSMGELVVGEETDAAIRKAFGVEANVRAELAMLEALDLDHLSHERRRGRDQDVARMKRLLDEEE